MSLLIWICSPLWQEMPERGRLLIRDRQGVTLVDRAAPEGFFVPLTPPTDLLGTRL